MYTFGPIPSRRLGQSLGVNHIPPKICTYTCVYCQQGHSSRMQAERQSFYSPQELYQNVKKAVNQAQEAGQTIDYISFVPDGEPTLDINLGEEIDLVKELGLPVAVITNSSLLNRQDVRQDLARADWVSVKIDAVDENTWRKIDRPLRSLSLPAILGGLQQFAQAYEGQLHTETMLVRGLNDSPATLSATAAFIAGLQPRRAYLAIPTRPPADRQVQPPDEKAISQAVQIFSQSLPDVEYLLGYEGNAFASTGKVEEDLLSITAVHPMREDAVEELLKQRGRDWKMVEQLLAENKLVEIEHDGHRFYMRKLYPGYKR
ncbi:MAG TPA: radical SAM protein [Syntrophomonadaceae bacterium]|nr:radical SAM protein [Syntrophomonadaceae bacterium]